MSSSVLGFTPKGRAALPLAAVVACATAFTAYADPNGVWTEMAPPNRNDHAAIYDPVRDRMLVIGGTNGPASSNEVWELALDPAASWHLLGVAGPKPAPRFGLGAIYDPVRDRIVALGGGNAAGFLGDVWALSIDSSPTWTQLSPAGTPPSARAWHTAIYDPVRDRMIVFGGQDANFNFPDRNDVWALTLGGTPAWSQLEAGDPPGLPPSATRPHPRFGSSAVYDPLGDRMVMALGEDNETNDYNDAWALSLGASPAWTKLLPSGTPPAPRSYAGTAYDPVRRRMMLFGGSGTFSETWALSLNGSLAWTNVTPSGTTPLGRAQTSLVYDSARDRMLLYGGTGYVSGMGYLPGDDVWALSLDASPAWTPLVQPVRPAPQKYHTAILDPLRNRMILCGGGAPNGKSVWSLNLGTVPSWVLLPTTGDTLANFYEHVAIYDPDGDRMIVFGGSYGDGGLWQLSLTDPLTWTAVPISGPGPRIRAAAAYDPIGHRMILFGGRIGGTTYADTWALTLDGPLAWTQLSTPTHPRGCYGAKMVLDAANSRMLLIGADRGIPDTTHVDCWALSLGPTPAWSLVSVGGTVPGNRSGHSMAYDALRSRVLLESGVGLLGVSGGTSYYGPVDDTQALDVSGTPTWGALAPAGSTPGGRAGATSIYDADLDRLILFGGSENDAGVQVLSFADAPPPLPASLTSATRAAGQIQLEWQGREVYRPSALLYRKPSGGAWAPLTTLVPDGTNRLSYDDTQVSDGQGYQYVVAFAASGGAQYGETASLGATTGVGDGADVRFAIQSVRFGAGGLDVAFALPSGAPARLELYDVLGRRVGSADLAGMGAGAHSVRVGSSRTPSGLYWVRLSQAGKVKVAKAVRLR